MAVKGRASAPPARDLERREALIALRVIPNAARDEIAGMHGNAVKIRCTAPALDGRANEAVIDILATGLGIRRSRLRLQRGEKSREKTVSIAGLDRAAVFERLGLAPAGSAPAP